MNNKRFSFAITSLLLIISFMSPITSANPVTYQVTMTVDTVFDLPAADLQAPPHIGSQYFMRFTIDDAILAGDGVNKAGFILDFSAHIGASLWNPNGLDSGIPDVGNDFVGFRGPCFGPISCTPAQDAIWRMDSDYLGFNVEGGKITGLWGGVYGALDTPFIDFQGNRYSANNYYLEKDKHWPADGPSSRHLLGTLGTFDFAQVPEPGSIALFGIGLLGLCLRRRQGS